MNFIWLALISKDSDIMEYQKTRNLLTASNVLHLKFALKSWVVINDVTGA